MAEVRLACLSPEHAAAVVAEATWPGDTTHTVRQDGDVVVIGYQDLRWPMDMASWAFENGHAHDGDASSVIASLRRSGRLTRVTSPAPIRWSPAGSR